MKEGRPVVLWVGGGGEGLERDTGKLECSGNVSFSWLWYLYLLILISSHSLNVCELVYFSYISITLKNKNKWKTQHLRVFRFRSFPGSILGEESLSLRIIYPEIYCVWKIVLWTLTITWQLINLIMSDKMHVYRFY